MALYHWHTLMCFVMLCSLGPCWDLHVHTAAHHSHAESGGACSQRASFTLRRRMAELRKAERAALLAALVAYQLPTSGHEGYAKASTTHVNG